MSNHLCNTVLPLPGPAPCNLGDKPPNIGILAIAVLLAGRGHAHIHGMLEWDDERSPQWRRTTRRAETVQTEHGRTRRYGSV